MTTPAEALQPVSAAVEPAAATAAAAATISSSDATAPATAPVEPSKAQEMMEEQGQRHENGGNGGVDTWHGGGRKVGMDILVKAE